MRNADRLRVFVDGALDGSGFLPPGYDLSGVSQHNACIGAITDHRDSSLFKYFVGLIDEVCIFAGAMDTTGVRSLYAGEDPAKVAQTSIIARAAHQPPPRQVAVVAGKGIEGDWEIVSSQVGQKAVIPIRRNPDGTLTAAIVLESADVAAPTIPLDEVTFQNGKLHFNGGSPPGVFEGTMKEDGLIIEGQFRQQGQTMTLALKRVVAAVTKPAPASSEQLQGQTSSASNIITVLILVIALAGVAGGIVFFLVKSSIR